METLDLDKPIFAFYMPLGNMPQRKAQEKMLEISKKFDYENITCWFFPIKDGNARVELVYPGRK